MKARITLAAMALAAVTCVMTVYAQTPPSSKAPTTEEITKLKDDLRHRELILARQFQEFQDSLLRLKQRLERSGKLEDRERAAQLQRVLEESNKLGVGVQFEQMVEFLKTNKFGALGDIKIALEKSNKLADDLRKLLDAMRQDSKHAKLRDERMRLEQLIKDIEKVIHDERVVQAQTELGKTEIKELKGNQQKVTDATNKIAKAMSDKGIGDAKNPKGENKDSGKGKGQKSEAKDAGDQSAKTGQAKEGGDSKENKGDAKGDQVAKDNKDNPGDAKGSKGGDPKEAGAKGSKAGEGQAQAKDGKNDKKGDEVAAKDAGEKSTLKEKAEAKGAKDAEKTADAKAGAKGSPSKDGAAKGSKGDQAKAGDPKEGGKPSESQGQAKAGDKSQGQSDSKPGEQQANNKDDGKKPSAGPQDPKDNLANGKKRVEDAEYKMKQAEDKIAKKDNPGAGDDQGRAITDLEKAKKKLEELLRQIREEELERLLAALQARCEKMLAMQISVYNGTQGVYKSIEGNDDKKANRQQQQDSLKLSDNEKDIVLEASKAMEMLEAEGSAVAFPEVFQQVREDMKHVQRRLEVTDTGVVTQAIETDIIDTLKEMIEALKKARQELDNKKNNGPPKEGQPPPNADQKLLEQIAELKMIRSMQLRVNNRTQTYAKMYVPREGEQTSDPNIRRELHNLSERQERIFDVTNRIAKGDNK